MYYDLSIYKIFIWISFYIFHLMNITFAGHHVLGKYIVSDPPKHIVQQDKDRAYEEAPDTTALDLGDFVWLEWTRS